MGYNFSGKFYSTTIYFILIACVSGSSYTYAQHQRSLDSLYQLKTPIDRVRGYLGSAEEMKLSEEELLKYAQDVEKLAKDKNDDFLLQHILFHKEHQKMTKNYGYAEKIPQIQKLAEQYKNKGDLLYAGYCYHFIGQQYFWLQEYGFSFENFFAAYEIFEKIGFENVPTISKFLHDFALSRYYFKDYTEVIRLMHISKKHLPFNSNFHIQRYNNLGASYSKLKIRDSAFYYFEKTKTLAKKYQSSTWQGIIFGNIGDIYYEEKQYQKAFQNYKNQYDILKDSPFYPMQIRSRVSLTNAYLALDSLNKANELIIAIEKSLENKYKLRDFGENQQIETLKKDFYEIKYKYLLQKKHFELAVLYKDSLAKAEYNLAEKYNAATVKMSENRFTIQNKELKLANAQKEKANQRFMYSIIIGAILIISILIYSYLFMSKLKKKRQNEKLIAQSRIAILEKHKAKQELELAKKEIQQFVFKVNEHSKIISKLEEDLKKLKNLELEEKNQVKKTINDLKTTKILTEDDWVGFQQNFELIFPDYTNSLKLYVPSITSSEIRYLMLSKLNLNNKEMAKVLGVTETAIRVTWNRVRKKLNGTTEDSPNTLVERILQNKAVLIN